MSSSREDYDERLEETHGSQLATAVLLLYIDSCKQLPLPRAGASSKPDPVVQVAVSGRPGVKETRMVKWSRHPVYEEGFVFLVNNPELDHLNLKVYDNRTKTELGGLRLSLANLLGRQGMEYFNQPFKLKKSATEATITIHLQLYFTKKILAPRKVSELNQNCDSDDISVFSLGAEPGSWCLKKMSVISGGSLESLAQPARRTQGEIVGKLKLTELSGANLSTELL